VQLPESTEAATRTRLRRRFPDATEARPPAVIEAAIDGIAALLEDELPDVRILDRKQFQDPAADHVALAQQRVAPRRSCRT